MFRGRLNGNARLLPRAVCFCLFFAAVTFLSLAGVSCGPGPTFTTTAPCISVSDLEVWIKTGITTVGKNYEYCPTKELK